VLFDLQGNPFLKKRTTFSQGLSVMRQSDIQLSAVSDRQSDNSLTKKGSTKSRLI
jgi:hypothetical protein